VFFPWGGTSRARERSKEKTMNRISGRGTPGFIGGGGGREVEEIKRN